VSGPAKDLIRRLLVKDAKKRLSAKDVLNHQWLDNNNQTSLSTPAKIRKDNSARQLSLACESVAAVNRVVLQHMSINILDTVTDNLVGLSPPSDSMMMQRRKSLQKGQSLQLNRLNNNNKVLTIQDLVGPVPIVSPSCWKVLRAIRESLYHLQNQQVNKSSYLSLFHIISSLSGPFAFHLIYSI